MIATSEKGPNLTLYGIEMQLIQLLNFRDEVSTDPDMTPSEQKESLEAIDQQIQEYVTAEVKKVDGVAHYLREFGARAEVLQQEAKRCAELANGWKRRKESLQQMIISIMQQTGATRLDGRTSVLSLRKNPPTCEVAQPELVPDDLQRVTLKMTRRAWRRILDKLDATILTGIATDVHEGPPEPMKTEISKRLKEGDGVPGCRLTQGVRLEVR